MPDDCYSIEQAIEATLIATGVYIGTHGKLPDDSWVLRTCDNVLCTSADHLVLGTRAEFVAEMASYGLVVEDEYQHAEMLHHVEWMRQRLTAMIETEGEDAVRSRLTHVPENRQARRARERAETRAARREAVNEAERILRGDQ